MIFARWLVGLLSLGYLIGAVYYYDCQLKQVWCYDRPAAAVPALPPPPAAAPDDARPVVFGYGYARPQLRAAAWTGYRDSVLAHLPAGQTLEIVGLYYADEPIPEGYPNMGMARAAALRRSVGERLPEEHILLAGRRLPAPETARNGLYRLSEFNYLAAEAKAEVVELPDRIVIYFPAAKSERAVDPQVERYLDRLAARIELTGQTVTLTGHTDTDGPAARNLELGRRRAEAIRTVLLEKEVPPGRIRVTSLGETDPVADNTSPLGKQRNRRVELRLVD